MNASPMVAPLLRWIRILLVLSVGLASCQPIPVFTANVATPGRTAPNIQTTSRTPGRANLQPVSFSRASSDQKLAMQPTATPQPAGMPIRIMASNLLPLPAPAPALQQEAISFEELVSRTQALNPIFQDLYNRLDRTQFDLNALSATLGYDLTSAITFVREKIAFEQYPGILRGEVGTLIGQAGNTIDKALLLRRLLDDAGYETRIVRGTLSPEQAQALISQMAAARPLPNPPVEASTFDNTANALTKLWGETISDEPGSASAAAHQDIAEGDTKLIYEALAAANIQPGSAQLMDQLIEEARDYFWVQYRNSAFENWQDVHPAFADRTAEPTGIAVQETYRDQLPPELHHRLRIEVFVEQKIGDTLAVHPILTGWERPAADLIGVPITFRNQPDNASLQTAADIDSMLLESHLFLPVIDGHLAEKAFDISGNVFGVAALGPTTVGATALTGALTGALGDAIGALNSEGAGSTTAQETITLTAQWIEYTLLGPGGQSSTTRRYIMDRIGGSNRALGVPNMTDGFTPLEASKQLLTNHTIMVMPGEYNPAFRLERILTSLQNNTTLMTYAYEHPDLDAFPMHTINDLIPTHDVFYSYSLTSEHLTQEGSISYLSAPMVVVFQDGIVPGRAEDTGFQHVDIISNTRRVLHANGGSIEFAPMEAIRQGVWETYNERVLVQGAVLTQRNAFVAMRDAAAASIPLLVLRPEDESLVSTLQYNELTRVSVLQDLTAGHVVIIPERSPDGSGVTGWWRVDPTTGRTLGIGAGGYGQQYVEYLISLTFGGVFGFLGYKDCVSSGGGAGCCFALNAGVAVMGMAFGFAIAARMEAFFILRGLGSPFGVSFLGSDVLLNMGTMFGLPNPC